MAAPQSAPAITAICAFFQPLALDAPGALFLILFVTGAVLARWWSRERELAGRTQVMRLLHQASEEIIGAGSPAEIVARLNGILPKISVGLQANIHVFDRGGQALDQIEPGPDSAVCSIRVDGPAAGLASAIALCYQNRTLITVPNVRRSPFFEGAQAEHGPRSLILVPMFAQSELAGVMTVRHRTRAGFFRDELQTAMQHLANQVAYALKLQDQKSIRERLFRSEKLAASGQLVSGVAGDLRSPLGSIIAAASSLRARLGDALEPELGLIEAEALRSAEIVSRLVAFGQSDQSEAKSLEIHSLLAGLLRPVLRECRQKGIEVSLRLSHRQIHVLGSQPQMEQVFRSLLEHAGKAAHDAPGATIVVSSSLLAQRMLVEIAYSVGRDWDRRDPFETADDHPLGLNLCQSVVRSHGGDIRFVQANSKQCRFEVELPTLEAGPRTATVGSVTPGSEVPEPDSTARRTLTALLVEPDMPSQRQLVDCIAKRGDRVVPVGSAEEAAELTERLHFDVTFCATQLPGQNWMELFERVRRGTGAFVLLTPGHDPELAAALEKGEGYALAKPVDEVQLNRICDLAAERLGAAK